MGCCVSAASNSKPHHFNIKQSSSSSPPPPPPTHPLPEEETVVKEVLTETPSLPKPSTTSSVDDENDQPKKAMLVPPAAPLPKMQKNHQHHQQLQREDDVVLKKPRMVFNLDELSEDASEICSTLTESVSAATEQNKVMDDEYDVDVNDDAGKIRQRSPAKHRNRMVSAESPVRRSEPSPGRVRAGGRERDANGLRAYGQRRGYPRSSDRRSRSPAMHVDESGKRTGLGRCPSARRTGKSPSRVGSELGDETRRVQNGNGNGREDTCPPTSRESLENPLVSLECFIFL